MSIHVRIITPLGELLDREIEELMVKSSTGWLSILESHSDLITPLSPAVIHYKTKEHIYDLAMTSGVLRIDNKGRDATIVADAVFYKNQIDFKLVSEFLNNAKKRLAMVELKNERKDLKLKIAEHEAQITLLDLPGRYKIR